MHKHKLLFLLLCFTSIVFAQTDTTNHHGTIKISKPKEEGLYIKAYINFDKYDLSKIKENVSKDMIQQPTPIVENGPHAFSYSNYFIQKFKTKSIDLNGLRTDTVFIEVKVLSNGKFYARDKTPLMMMNGVPAFYNKAAGAYQLNNLHIYCVDFTKQLNIWQPAYVLTSKRSRFKGQTVLKPKKEKVTATGILTIVFSTVPYEN
jgi:hypothetical protein